MYNVLIADESPLQRKALSKIVSEIDGFDVAATTSDKHEILERIQDSNIDILFMNALMD